MICSPASHRLVWCLNNLPAPSPLQGLPWARRGEGQKNQVPSGVRPPQGGQHVSGNAPNGDCHAFQAYSQGEDYLDGMNVCMKMLGPFCDPNI